VAQFETPPHHLSRKHETLQSEQPVFSAEICTQYLQNTSRGRYHYASLLGGLVGQGIGKYKLFKGNAAP
jgi:hypothetical protein